MEADATLKGNCILCAEDNDLNQIILDLALSEQELPYFMVNNGQEVVKAWKSLEPLVILMDISMPVMDGLEAIRQIREAEAGTGNHVPIVALTAHAMEGDRDRMLAGGADYYIPKPIQPAQLREKLAIILEDAPGERRAVG